MKAMEKQYKVGKFIEQKCNVGKVIEKEFMIAGKVKEQARSLRTILKS
jgi:hypothetical protein